MMNASELLEFAKGYTEAWCSHEPTQPAGFFAGDGSISVNGGDAYVGRASIAELVQSFYDGFPDCVVIMDEVRGAGDKAVYLWTFEGTNTGPGGTGNKVSFNGWEAWTLSPEGLIAESIGSFDSDEYARQLAEGV